MERRERREIREGKRREAGEREEREERGRKEIEREQREEKEGRKKREAVVSTSVKWVREPTCEASFSLSSPQLTRDWRPGHDSTVDVKTVLSCPCPFPGRFSVLSCGSLDRHLDHFLEQIGFVLVHVLAMQVRKGNKIPRLEALAEIFDVTVPCERGGAQRRVRAHDVSL